MLNQASTSFFLDFLGSLCYTCTSTTLSSEIPISAQTSLLMNVLVLLGSLLCYKLESACSEQKALIEFSLGLH